MKNQLRILNLYLIEKKEVEMGKKRMKCGLVVVLCVAIGFLSAYPGIQAAENSKPLVQIAILLDTSGSMSGLISQAKSQLWKIVNEFATAKRDGQNPELRVALYEYGNNSISSEEGYVRMLLSLTTDLDKVSESLFALTTNGGSEYCGKVIQSATEELNWSGSNSNYKVIFIAGNEPFTQGNVDYRKSCKAAITKGIIINTIHCGSYERGVSTKWKDGADLADGKYLNIDQNTKAIHIDAPQDKKIAHLGAELNKTYIPYGEKGKESKERQVQQEKNALSVGGSSFVQRQLSKVSVNYKNQSWDLVDGLKTGNVKLEELKDEELPEEMRKMNEKERKEYVGAQAEEREKIKKEISNLNEERKKYIAKEMAKLSKSGKNSLDTIMIDAIRQQASKKNFRFK